MKDVHMGKILDRTIRTRNLILQKTTPWGLQKRGGVKLVATAI
jgi:hypothetical protein